MDFEKPVRAHYYTGQLLQESDFTVEQRYHMEGRIRHVHALHEWGVADGLEVSYRDSTTISISPGLAVDSKGNEIVVPSGTVSQISIPLNSGEGWITVKQKTENLDRDLKNMDPDETQYERISEVPEFEHVAGSKPNDKAPDADFVVLASLQSGAEGIDPESINNDVRNIAGPKLQDGMINTPQLADEAVALSKIRKLRIPEEGTLDIAMDEPGVGPAQSVAVRLFRAESSVTAHLLVSCMPESEVGESSASWIWWHEFVYWDDEAEQAGRGVRLNRLVVQEGVVLKCVFHVLGDFDDGDIVVDPVVGHGPLDF